MSGGEQLTRVVQLVAELSRDPLVVEEGLALSDIATRLGCAPADVQRDLRTLTSISDDADTEWLQSLSVWQEGDRVCAASRGPFRRPMRFTPDELLAIRVGLALESRETRKSAQSGIDTLAVRLRALTAVDEGAASEPVHLGPAPGDGEGRVLALAREAVERNRVLTILYAGEREFPGASRSIEPHELVGANGRWYVVAWCRRAHDWRHFRADRVLDITLENRGFERRADFSPVASTGEVFRSADEADAVVVRFNPEAARWLAERFPDAERHSDGSLTVTYRVVEPAWLVRTILQYGDAAEVIAPAEYRALVRRAVGH